MATTYTRTLPNLNLNTRRIVYERLSTLMLHLENLGTDILSISIDVPTRVLTVTLTNPIADLGQRQHLGLEDE